MSRVGAFRRSNRQRSLPRDSAPRVVTDDKLDATHHFDSAIADMPDLTRRFEIETPLTDVVLADLLVPTHALDLSD
jgi:hypothetical protein